MDNLRTLTKGSIDLTDAKRKLMAVEDHIATDRATAEFGRFLAEFAANQGQVDLPRTMR